MTAQFVPHDSHYNYYTATNAMLAIAEGKVIDAIKIIRKLDTDAYGHGLKEAKDVVEACMAGGHARTVQRQDKPHAYTGGVYAVMPTCDVYLTHYNRVDAEDDAKARATTGNPHYVVQALSKVSVTVKVENCT